MMKKKVIVRKFEKLDLYQGYNGTKAEDLSVLPMSVHFLVTLPNKTFLHHI